jgi:hypothetical protein
MVSHRPGRWNAQERLAAQRRRRSISAQLEQLAPLAGPDGHYTRRRVPSAILDGAA